MKKIIIIALVAVILIGGGVAAYFLFILPSMQEAEANKPIVLYSYSTGDYFVTNVKDTGHHLKATVVLKYVGDEAEVKTSLDDVKYEIRDKIIEVLRSVPQEDLLGDDGMQITKREILSRLRSDLGLGSVQGVVLSDFVVQ